MQNYYGFFYISYLFCGYSIMYKAVTFLNTVLDNNNTSNTTQIEENSHIIE